MAVKFYKNASGRAPAREFVDMLPIETQREFFDYVGKLGAGESLGMPVSRSMFRVYRRLYELRLRDGFGQYRIFYFIKAHQEIYIVHAFKKKTQKTPRGELELAFKRAKEIDYAI
jgi:phage-related protein